MIKFTYTLSKIITNRFAVIIPGGPGLSSLTLRSLDLLQRSMNLIYVDFQGTNDVPYLKDTTYDDLVNVFKIKLETEIPTHSNVFLICHSFGGLFGASLSELDFVKGLICIGVPFSKETVKAAGNCYLKNLTANLAHAEKNFERNKDDKSFRDWLSEYDKMYFINSSGRELLLRDKVSARLFLAHTDDIHKGESLLRKLSEVKKLKLMIAGKEDGLIPAKNLETDSKRAGFRFIELEGASHFVTYDQPELVAKLIEEQIAQFT